MTNSTDLNGCGTALVTPFTESGRIDEAALRALVETQIAAGVHFVVPCGSTGEAATLSTDEHARVISIVAETAAGRIPVVAGAGSNDTARAISLSKIAQEAGATHLLHVSPMYNKPPQRALVEHFHRVADASLVPIMLYNVPSRTGGNVEASTTLKLAGHPNIFAVKEASGNMTQIDIILRERPDGFAVFSGDDALTLPMMALGAEGVVSVVSNVFPAAMSQLTTAMLSGDLNAARALHRALLPFFSGAFVESNPIPAKAVLAADGLIANVLRLPLVPLSSSHADTVFASVAQVRQALAELGVSPALNNGARQ